MLARAPRTGTVEDTGRCFCGALSALRCEAEPAALRFGFDRGRECCRLGPAGFKLLGSEQQLKTDPTDQGDHARRLLAARGRNLRRALVKVNSLEWHRQRCALPLPFFLFAERSVGYFAERAVGPPDPCAQPVAQLSGERSVGVVDANERNDL